MRELIYLDNGKTHVGNHEVGQLWISTVRLPVSYHGFDFETMIFGIGLPSGMMELWCDRYTTYEDAAIGHTTIVGRCVEDDEFYDSLIKRAYAIGKMWTDDEDDEILALESGE